MECGRMNKELHRKCCQSLAKEHDPVERFKLLALKTGLNGIKNIFRQLRIGDINNDKKIHWDHFRWVCLSCGIEDLSEDDLKIVFCHFDRDATGRINFDEFLLAVRPHMNAARKKLAKMAFAKMDQTGDGVITADDLIDTYDVSKHSKYLNGEMTKKQVYVEFLKGFDVDAHCKGKKDEEEEGPITITLEEWMDYFSGVSASVDDDAYFNLMIRNAWGI